jgi:hypothetical protein
LNEPETQADGLADYSIQPKRPDPLMLKQNITVWAIHCTLLLDTLTITVTIGDMDIGLKRFTLVTHAVTKLSGNTKERE